jgi:hypothetical protein
LYLFAIVVSKEQADDTKLVKDIVEREQRPDDLGSRDELVSCVHAPTLGPRGVSRKTLMRTCP